VARKAMENKIASGRNVPGEDPEWRHKFVLTLISELEHDFAELGLSKDTEAAFQTLRQRVSDLPELTRK
jgi:hypothetical protein